MENTPRNIDGEAEAKQIARQFAENNLLENVQIRDQTSTFSRELWDLCAGFGIQGLPIPEEFGGSGETAKFISSFFEGMGSGSNDAGLLFSMVSQLCTVEIPLIRFGSEEQKQKYLPRLADGSIIGASAITETEAGSDVYSLSTKAEAQKGEYIINGHKSFVTNGPIADVFIIYATVNREIGQFGITAFIVDRDNQGLRVGENLPKMGLRTSPLGDLFFSNCKLTKDNILGVEGAGATIFQLAMEWERSCGFSWQVGVMERNLEKCLDFVKNREQFNKPISEFQSVSNRIVDMKLRLELSKLILQKAVSGLDQNPKPSIDSALAKLYISEAAHQNHIDSLRIHGGAGYMTELEIERTLRDSLGGIIYSGTSDIQKVIIAKQLGL